MYSSTKRRMHQRRWNKAHLTEIRFTHDLDKCGDGNVQRIHSKDNLVDLFIKALPTTMFAILRCNIGM